MGRTLYLNPGTIFGWIQTPTAANSYGRNNGTEYLAGKSLSSAPSRLTTEVSSILQSEFFKSAVVKLLNVDETLIFSGPEVSASS